MGIGGKKAKKFTLKDRLALADTSRMLDGALFAKFVSRGKRGGGKR